MWLYPLDTKEYWDWLWDQGAESDWGKPGGRKEVRLNFHKYTTIKVDRIRAAIFVEKFGWDINTALCVYGCGFGWILMALWEHGIQNIQGIEQSTYVQDNLTINEDTDIIAAIQAVGLDPSTGDGLTIFNALRDDGNPRAYHPTRIHDKDPANKQDMNDLVKLLGSACTVLTYGDFPLNRLDDTQAVELAENLDKNLKAGRVIHFINPEWALTDLPGNGGQVDLNNKTGEEWKIHLPDHTFIEESTFRVVE